MKISEIITDKYKLRIPPTVYYELLTDVQEVEEDQEPTTKTCKTCRNYGSHNGVCDICKDYNCFTEPNNSIGKNDLRVDAVSRAEVLKIFDEWVATCDIADKKASPKAKIKALPSITPQLSSELEKNSKKLEKGTTKNDLGVDAISREKAIKWAEFYTEIYDAEVANKEIVKMLKDLPSVHHKSQGK